jgi:hypothetical protein
MAEIPGYGFRFAFGDPGVKRDWRKEMVDDPEADEFPAENKEALRAMLGVDPDEIGDDEPDESEEGEEEPSKTPQ